MKSPVTTTTDQKIGQTSNYVPPDIIDFLPKMLSMNETTMQNKLQSAIHDIRLSSGRVAIKLPVAAVLSADVSQGDGVEVEVFQSWGNNPVFHMRAGVRAGNYVGSLEIAASRINVVCHALCKMANKIEEKLASMPPLHYFRILYHSNVCPVPSDIDVRDKTVSDYITRNLSDIISQHAEKYDSQPLVQDRQYMFDTLFDHAAITGVKYNRHNYYTSSVSEPKDVTNNFLVVSRMPEPIQKVKAAVDEFLATDAMHTCRDAKFSIVINKSWSC